MRKFRMPRSHTLFALAGALLLILGSGAAIAFAGAGNRALNSSRNRTVAPAPVVAQSDAPQAGATVVHLDSTDVTYKQPDQIHWMGRAGFAQQAVLVGNPMKPGLYVVLLKWYPHHMSHPHFHPNDRYITVLSGTWWVGTGTKFDPNHMIAMPAGSFVTDLAKRPHYDGAKAKPAVIEIVGMGPATMTPDETK